MNRVFIIAEAGVNHNGSVELALEMIDAAASAGADAVKFQTFEATSLASKDAPKAEYQKGAREESQLEMLKRLELGETAHKQLISHCMNRGVAFISSPFDLNSIDLLNSLKLNIFKIPSGEITNLPYLRKLGSLQKRIILSTGMANMTEIGDALDVLIRAGTKREDITVLHANTQYPTPMEDVNLRSMRTIGDAFGVAYGYSDHTPGIEVSIAAVALGASVVEKHFTLDKGMEGPDHKASLDLRELSAMVGSIRNVERALGDGVKAPGVSEMQNIAVVRKSIVASSPISKGDIFTSENIAVKRPGGGISPMRWDEVIGTVSRRDYVEDELI